MVKYQCQILHRLIAWFPGNSNDFEVNNSQLKDNINGQEKLLREVIGLWHSV